MVWSGIKEYFQLWGVSILQASINLIIPDIPNAYPLLMYCAAWKYFELWGLSWLEIIKFLVPVTFLKDISVHSLPFPRTRILIIIGTVI